MELAREVLDLPSLSGLPALDRWTKAKLQDAIAYNEAAVFVALMCNVIENFLPETMLTRFRQLPIAPYVTHDGAGLQMKLAALKEGRAMIDAVEGAILAERQAGNRSFSNEFDFDAFFSQLAEDFLPGLKIPARLPNSASIIEAILKKE